MYRCSKLVYVGVQRNETDSSGGRKLFSQESLSDKHISTGQNVRQIKSCAGYNRILTFLAGKMSNVRRYFKAWFAASYFLADIQPISKCVRIACSDLMITSLLQVVNRLDPS